MKLVNKQNMKIFPLSNSNINDNFFFFLLFVSVKIGFIDFLQ